MGNLKPENECRIAGATRPPAGISSLRFQSLRFQIPLAPLFIGKKIGIWDINYQ